MKIRVVSTRNEILSLNPNEKVVHLAFRPSNKDVFLLVETCPKLEVIQLPKSYRRTVSRAIEMFLEIQKVELLEGDVWGHRKDINEYFIIPSSVISKIRSMKAQGTPAERIVEKIAQESKLDPKMVSYIMSRKDLE
ncbi:MAG: DUF1699 family protein [Methanosarcina thermophila]|jgi:hypothetical protein|uniref:Ribosomal protein S6 n=3 Tax=Methanosarcina thermophila TaxID=2210 RepID=A0A1I6XSJ7_METTE|nr:DUF1699 family protein [Methanosarcina thermophila]ALK05694.1 MAG: hypothetical protein AAY43_08285 [Methanosarcina sp. 795]AKB12854.1 Ribosomal protein S6 [Methanosarcina thermophila TM-1]AKB16525.1 Ribosomal protein S6 [Methanosarcina thermophila CHTI-55]NLU56878.1 DUF1699 family protein [Methanosarcina thermophila]SFT41378.1 Protein of unknown function [Methanosarcina thermophila]